MKKLISILFILALSVSFYSQSFTNNTSLLPNTFNSGGCVGVADMDQDGLDDIIVLDGADELNIYYQEPDGSFVSFFYGDVGGSQWGMCAADVDQDGHKDVICGGSNDGVHYVQISARGVSSQTNLNNGTMFMQGCNTVDIDNDGWLDVFGCHDVSLSRTWSNDQAGNLTFDASLMDLTNYDYTAYPGTDHSGNYGSVWTDIDGDGDIDMYLAKCRQGVNDPLDPRRINQLWINDGAGNFTEEAAIRGLVFNEQSWTSEFADIDNDGDFDCFVTNHSTNLMLLENDGNGFFTDISAAAGFSDTGFFLQAVMHDMDNDGFVDLIYTGGVHKYYHNNGDGTFTEIASTFPYSDVMHSLGVGDLNNDGSLDIYSSYGNGYVSADNSNPDILWLNDGNANNWISFDLQGISSNQNAVGANVELYGNWGTQIREVRSGESYGIVTSFKCHFGMGTETVVDSAVIEWPSGLITVMTTPGMNTVHVVPEAPCTIAGLTVTPAGPHELCPGDDIVLTAPAGYSSYMWSTGETTESILVNTQGNYSVVITDALSCLGLPDPVQVDVLVPTMPSASATGDLEFCEGGSVLLSASDGDSYFWSNGEITQDISAALSGTYTVDVTDMCGDTQTSNPIEVVVVAGPGVPDVVDVVIPAPGSATFTGTSDELLWYDAVDGVVPVETGNTFITPPIAVNTSFWVEDVSVYGGIQAAGAPDSTDNDGAYHTNSNNWVIFDAHEDFIIKTVKVYANGDGNRTIEVIDDLGGVVASGDYFMADGESIITVDLLVPQGTGYGLRSTTGDPQLWRYFDTTNGAGYPFDLGSLATITSSSISGTNQYNYYYFFYDWQIETPTTECVGPRIEVVASIAPQGCTDPMACNYDPAALVDDGSCDYSCLGCIDPGACNYDAGATIDDGSCDYSCIGCTDSGACNYDAAATIDDGSCYFNCLTCEADFNNDGVVDTSDLLVMLAQYGCGPPDSCTIGDFNNDSLVNVTDLLSFLSVFNAICDQN